jgi:hypothetical protein
VEKLPKYSFSKTSFFNGIEYVICDSINFSFQKSTLFIFTFDKSLNRFWQCNKDNIIRRFFVAKLKDS